MYFYMMISTMMSTGLFLNVLAMDEILVTWRTLLLYCPGDAGSDHKVQFG